MGTLLATRLKNRRKELKMSQRELAEGICKQGQISRLDRKSTDQDERGRNDQVERREPRTIQ